MSGKVLAIIIGTITGMLCIVFMQMAIYRAYPLPAGTDLYYADSVANAVKTMPKPVFHWLLVSYAIAAFIAGSLSTIISGRSSAYPALISAAVMTIAGAINAFSVHMPGWFIITLLFCYLPTAFSAWLLFRKKTQPF
ncbi:MAG: hypothetical protein JSS82_16190 [Bacteroidetes bacterium]|nr:hypothetical protein [Bacteroidota bacterium]